MGTTAAYNRGKYLFTKSDISLLDVRVLLVSSAYVFDPTHNVVSQVNSAELFGTGYVRKQLAGMQLVEDDVLNLVRFSGSDLTWTGANFGTPDAAILFVEEGSTDSSRELLMSYDLQPKVATNGVDWVLQWAAAGIALLQ